MKLRFSVVCALVCVISGATLGHAAQKCAAQKTAYDRALGDYNRAESQYLRLQYQVEAKAEQGYYRTAMLQANVEQAKGNLNAASQGALGQGIGCYFFRGGGCFGSAIVRFTQQVSRARAQVRAQEGRLYAYTAAFALQMSRLSQRVTEFEAFTKQKKVTLDTKEAEYQQCLAL